VKSFIVSQNGEDVRELKDQAPEKSELDKSGGGFSFALKAIY
jgi:hypothetical protein